MFFRRWSVILLVLPALWLGARYLLPIATPFLFAILMALAAEPLVNTLHRRLRLHRVLATGIGVSLVLTLTVLLLLALCALLVRQLSNLSGILPDLENATLSGLSALERWLLQLMQDAPQGIRSVLTHGVEGIFSNGSALLDRIASGLLNLATGLLKAIPDSVLGLGTWVLATFMFSARLPRIRSWLQSHLPPVWKEKYAPYLKALKKTLWGWVLAQAKLVGITFAFLCAGFLLLRISHPFLWAALTCLVDILPVLGTGTVLIPWSIVCFLQGQSIQGIGLLGIYGVISLVRSVLEPRFVGKQLGLDPLLTLLAIYAGYRLWGLLGMLVMPVGGVIVAQFVRQGKKST